jgi:myo-inositol 2-dehydrogenase / D-chiro-inositol 1-dehydrogenase
MTIHDFDMARWLLGEEVETVMAAASVLTDPEIGRWATSTASTSS